MYKSREFRDNGANVQRWYPAWWANSTDAQKAFADSVFAMCEEHYEDGGDIIVECFSPGEVCEEFTSLADAQSFCGLKLEQATNCRWGDDSDPQLKDMERFEQSGDWTEDQ